jgi:hypothetical protein
LSEVVGGCLKSGYSYDEALSIPLASPLKRGTLRKFFPFFKEAGGI